MSDHGKDIEILALRHQLTALQDNSATSDPGTRPRTGPSWPHCERPCADCDS
ncbi:hypothetical protein ACIQGZ_20350 [Streptomyces sp. NPDC092296]|uniref:hypothetical protein n=1 Tax=Streptomyces sp. NPDC092296 TaxID=3366012 RepID=UPI003820641E